MALASVAGRWPQGIRLAVPGGQQVVSNDSRNRVFAMKNRICLWGFGFLRQFPRREGVAVTTTKSTLC